MVITDTILSEDLILYGVCLQVMRPSPYFESTPQQQAEYQSMKNYYLKIKLRLDRAHKPPVKVLPLP